MYVTTIRLSFLYIFEETLLMLFCNRKTTYFNPPELAGGCIFHLILYI
jgi:hypothetical protein